MTLKYFLPDWEDRLDPNFDFINDTYSIGHVENPYLYDSYCHQLLTPPPYDGILISLSVFQSKMKINNNNGIYSIRNCKNIRDYLKIPKESDLKVMGDCGAFSYVDMYEPPISFYNTENISAIYDKLGFDFGVSIDHLAVEYILEKDKVSGKRKKRFLTEHEKEIRVKITLRNAKQFIRLYERNQFGFKPIGVAQGYDISSYVDSVDALVNMGYSYIGIGSLIQYKSDFIIKLLKEIKPVTKGAKLHLFGILRPNYLKDFENLGVCSYDSASFLRKAWLKSAQNYLSLDGKWYSAIRVPQSSNPRLVKNATLNGLSYEDLKKMENEALQILFKYDAGDATIDQVLDTVLEYDNLLLRGYSDVKNLKPRYMRTLQDKPWKACNCELCRILGIQIMIFRGCNRNKRRGFHNIWAFRKLYYNNLNE